MSDETAYCVKCRKKTVIKDSQQVQMKNGRPAMKGVCSECGTGVYKIQSKKQAPFEVLFSTKVHSQRHVFQATVRQLKVLRLAQLFYTHTFFGFAAASQCRVLPLLLTSAAQFSLAHCFFSCSFFHEIPFVNCSDYKTFCRFCQPLAAPICSISVNKGGSPETA